MMRGFQSGKFIPKDGKRSDQEREAFNKRRQNRTSHNDHTGDEFNRLGGLGNIKPTDDTRASLLEQISDAESVGRMINPDRTPGSSFYIYKERGSQEVKEYIALLRAKLNAHIAGQPEPGTPDNNAFPTNDR
jgi:hypothetical protein